MRPVLRRAPVLAAGGLVLIFTGCAAATPGSGQSATPAVAGPEVVVAVEPEAPPPPAATADSESPPPKTVFYVNRPFKEDSNLVLRRVTKEPDALRIDFVFVNKSNVVHTINVSPLGDPDAMFVELLDGRRLAFKSAEGISLKPVRDRVEPGGKRRFSLTFEPLPEGVTRFHVYEGAAAKSAPPGQTRFWFFRDIQLK